MWPQSNQQERAVGRNFQQLNIKYFYTHKNQFEFDIAFEWASGRNQNQNLMLIKYRGIYSNRLLNFAPLECDAYPRALEATKNCIEFSILN